MSFRLGSIPIRIHGAFFFIALFLGMNQQDPRLIAIWVAVVFVSVLVHELGHALMGRAFGLAPRIDLHGMGGTTSWTSGPRIGNGKRVAISLAGPFAGFLLGAAVFLFATRLPPLNPLAKDAIRQMLFVNIGWGIFNLLPLLPLDGGNVMRATIDAATNGRGEKPARIVSIVLCAALLGLAVLQRSWWIGALAVMFGMTNFRALKNARTIRADTALVHAIEKAHAALEKQNGAEAIALLVPALGADVSAEVRSMGVQLLAYAYLLESEWRELLALLERERALVPAEELSRFARTAREMGRGDEAERIEALGKAPDPLGQFKA